MVNMKEIDAACSRFVEQLTQIQRREGWTERQMAQQLGMHHTTWYGIKRGRHNPGVRFIQNAVARFPELSGSAVLFLLSGVHQENNTVHDGNEPNGKAA